MTKKPFLPRLKESVFYWATHYTWTFVAVMTVTVVSCAFSIQYLATLETNLKDLYENDIRGGDSIQAASLALLGVESSVKDLILFPDSRTKERTRATMKARLAQLKAAMVQASPRFHTPRAKAALTKAREDLRLFLASVPENPDPASVARMEARSQTLQKDFDLLIANRTANSTIGITQLMGQLRLSLIFTIVILVVTVSVRVILYLAGHPGRRPPQSQEKLSRTE